MYKEMEYINYSCKLSWECSGVFPRGVDSEQINTVEYSKKLNAIMTGNDWGLVNLLPYPAKNISLSRVFRGHSEAVKKAIFSNDGQFAFSLGGFDHTII